MKWLYALVIGLGVALGTAGVASADGGTGYIDEDGTLGDFAETTSLGIVTYLRPIDDNAIQDMELYDPDQGTWPVDPDGNV